LVVDITGDGVVFGAAGKGPSLSRSLARGCGHLHVEGVFESIGGVFPVLESVVIAAEEGEVVEDGFASVGPVGFVVHITPFRRPATTVGCAVAVSGDSRSA
jgi:hypothetical protein